MLIDSGATGNFISDRVMATLELQVEPEEEAEELSLADGSMVKASGYVQFRLQCGKFKQDVRARVFPNLHKEVILGMPWLERTNPVIDWMHGHVKVRQDRKVMQLPLVTKKSRGSRMGEVSVCSAKQMRKWIKQGGESFLGIIRRVAEPVPVVPEQQ